MRSNFSITLLFLALFLLLAAAARWEPIKDLSSPYVKEIANFSVTAFNQLSKRDIMLVAIKKGFTEADADKVIYHLIVSASEWDTLTDYVVAVLDDAQTHERKLLGFTPIIN